MSEGRPSRAPVDMWQANQLRLTFFATPDALPLQTDGWWEAVTGAAPERIEDKPKLGQHLEDGPSLDGLLTLRIEGNRIDWIIYPLIDPTKGIDDIPSLGTFPDVRHDFLGLLLRWIPSAPSCHRLGLGARLVQRVPSREEGYRSLAAYLPFSPDPESSSDLKYQINRPRRSSIRPDLKINRLQTWMVLFLRTSLAAEYEGGHLPPPGIFLQEKWSIALELDVNTDADSLVQLPREQLVALVGELSDLATGVTIEGDRP